MAEEKSSQKEKFVITLEECHQTYQNLIKSDQIDTSPYRKTASLEIISTILETFSVQILPCPRENVRKKLWNKDKKSISLNYSKMLKSMHSRKFAGVFYSSESHCEFAKPSKDISVEESWTTFQFR